MKYDRIYFTGGGYETCFNLTKSVGIPGDNLFDDVMLVQAILRLIALSDPDVAGFGGPQSRIPEITGVMDIDTYAAIVQFQITHKSELLTKVSDGRIDPARYKGRPLPRGPGPVMTITLLHYMAKVTDRDPWSRPTPVVSQKDEVPYRSSLEAMNAQLKAIFSHAVLALVVDEVKSRRSGR
jgi:hypothetical protein